MEVDEEEEYEDSDEEDEEVGRCAVSSSLRFQLLATCIGTCLR